MFIGYHILIKFFKNGELNNDYLKEEYLYCEKNSIEGDIQGIIQNLDYLKELGIDLIYLGPIFDSNTTHGYDTTNYYSIASHISSKKNEESKTIFKNLITECKKRNMKVIIDLVLNHASKSYDFSKIPKQFSPKNESPQSLQEKKWQNLFLFWNLSDENTRDFLIDVGTYWLTNFDIDGFRLDHALGIEKNFWKDFSENMRKIKKEVILLGEVWEDTEDEEKNFELIESFKKYSEVNLFSSLYDFFMYENIKKFFVFEKITTDEFYEIIYKSNRLNDKEFSLTYFIENHDIPRFIDICKNKENFYDAMKILFSLSGNILLEYGNEFCIKGDPNYKYFSESGRVPMKFKNEFSDEESKIFEFTKKLIKIRKENESLSKGTYEKICSDKNTLIIKKSYKEDNCYILLSKTDTKFNENYYDIINEIEYPSSYILKKGAFL